MEYDLDFVSAGIWMVGIYLLRRPRLHLCHFFLAANMYGLCYVSRSSTHLYSPHDWN